MNIQTCRTYWQKGHLEFLWLIALFSLLAVPVVTLVLKDARRCNYTILEIGASLLVPALFFLECVLTLVALCKIEVAFHLDPSTIWTGTSLGQSVLRKVARVGILVAAGLLAAVLVGPKMAGVLWWSWTDIFAFALLWGFSLLPVAVALYYGVLGGRRLQTIFTAWYNRQGNHGLGR